MFIDEHATALHLSTALWDALILPSKEDEVVGGRAAEADLVEQWLGEGNAFVA